MTHSQRAVTPGSQPRFQHSLSPGILPGRSPGAYSNSSKYGASPEQLALGKVAEEE
jgi:hypothetical protein